MHALIVLHGAITWALVGLIWTVQLVLYPLFPLVRRNEESFAAYHWRHMVGISALVIPLALAEAGTAGLLLWQGERSGWLLASLVPLVINILSTALVQAPLHLRLRGAADVNLYRQLIRTNWTRTLCWTLRGILVGVLAVQS
jgi:hypothetical protein